MCHALISNPPACDPDRSGKHGLQGLADYRADRDDFSRLLYLVYREIRVRKETDQKRPA